MAGQTVRGAVAQREEQKQEVTGVETRLRAAREWFNTVVPSHIEGDQFIAMCIGALRKDPRLMAAATSNPGPFMVAASECARLGLVPGETYHFVAFRNSDTNQYDITGIVDYKGEIDMIYRAGGVLSVHGQVVRAADKFIWRPGMELPLHEILPNEQGQVGLADEDHRGPLTGVYAYARLKDGGYSAVVVMANSEVAKHEAVAKTDKFWKGPWRPDMYLKTAYHKLYDLVPHSQEYLAERLRAQSAPPIPLEVPSRQPAQIPGVPVVPGLAIERGTASDEVAKQEAPAAEDDTQKGRKAASRASQGGRDGGSRGAPPPPPQVTLTALFDDAGLAGEEYGGARLAVCRLLARQEVSDDPVPLNSLTDLTAEQLDRCVEKLGLIVTGKDEHARTGLLQLARAGGWEGDD